MVGLLEGPDPFADGVQCLLLDRADQDPEPPPVAVIALRNPLPGRRRRNSPPLPRRRMATLEPQKIGAHDWYYEYPTHMLLVHEVKHADGSHFRTDTIKIPWRKIAVSLHRYKPRKRSTR